MQHIEPRGPLVNASTAPRASLTSRQPGSHSPLIESQRGTRSWKPGPPWRGRLASRSPSRPSASKGPKAGEVLVEVMATGVCHTDAYTLSGLDSEGKFPAILGHEGAGIVREVGAGRHHAEAGRPRDPALHAGMPQVQNLPVAPHQPLHRDPRDAGPGRDAGRHQPLPLRRRARCSTTWAARPSRTSPCCRRSRWPRCARTRPSTRSATSAAASPPASAR